MDKIEGRLANHKQNAELEIGAAKAHIRSLESALRRAGVSTEHIFSPGASVLEIGAGPGHNQMMLRSRFPGLVYTEVDMDSQVSATSKARNPEGTIITADVFDYIEKVPDNSVHCVLGFNSFDQYTEQQLKKLARHIRRVLVPGGVFLHGITQDQAPTPMMSYLRSHRSTPDKSVSGRPIGIYKPVFESYTTGGIYLGTKAQVEKVKKIFAGLHARRDDSQKDAKLPSDDACVIAEGSFDSAHKAMLTAGLTHIPHNKLLQSILTETFRDAGFTSTHAEDVITSQIMRGKRGEQHTLLLRGIFTPEDAKRQIQYWDVALTKRDIGIKRRFLRSIQVDVLSSLYVVAKK